MHWNRSISSSTPTRRSDWKPGCKFYGYAAPDGLNGRVMSAPGDRLALVRAPDNPADANAVEIWWRNEHMLGHLPRGVAAELAPRLDGGDPVRAYVADPGTGETWSLVVLLVGRGVEGLHRQRLERLADTRAWEERLELLEACAEVWGRGRRYRRYDLYAVGDIVAMWEANPLAVAAAAETAFRAGRLSV